MNQATLRQFRYLDALARHGHFRRAAEACAISQPALSMQIKELEGALGAELIERGARRFRLTMFGEEAVKRVREILRAVDDLDALARAAQDGLVGRLSIGVIPTVAPYLLPRALRKIAAAHPALEIHVRETLTPTLIEALREGRLDTAILALPVSEPWLEEIALFSERFVLVRPAGEAVALPPSRESLREMRLLLLEEGHCFRDQALSFCSLPSAAPRDALDASSLSTLVQMVGAGLGVTLVPEMALEAETSSAPVSIARFDAPEPERTIGMVWRKTSPLAERLAQVAQAFRPDGAEPAS